jgi:hypothetical protein
MLYTCSSMLVKTVLAALAIYILYADDLANKPIKPYVFLMPELFDYTMCQDIQTNVFPMPDSLFLKGP